VAELRQEPKPESKPELELEAETEAGAGTGTKAGTSVKLNSEAFALIRNDHALILPVNRENR
jgi:uncharacterized spore protein YtfJ